MPLFALTVNSYKRLVGTSGAGDGVLGTGTSGRAGLHDQSADDERDATRLEVRVPGADANPHYASAAIVALGWRGGVRLPSQVTQGAEARFQRVHSLTRSIWRCIRGAFGGLEAVTDW
ncbi:hypothetical protein HFD88_002012 [Aspergillus terreus]|nr:hypothetical protein HFD88_002012 [Aspergillus terreus]